MYFFSNGQPQCRISISFLGHHRQPQYSCMCKTELEYFNKSWLGINFKSKPLVSCSSLGPAPPTLHSASCLFYCPFQMSLHVISPCIRPFMCVDQEENLDCRCDSFLLTDVHVVVVLLFWRDPQISAVKHHLLYNKRYQDAVLPQLQSFISFSAEVV